jgi:hypothetical protein
VAFWDDPNDLRYVGHTSLALVRRCPACGNEDVFLDVVRLDGESAEGFEARKAGLEATAGRVRTERLGVVVVERDMMSA